MKLYYLTCAQFALSNLIFRRIKIARLSELNDPFEFMAMNLTDPRLRNGHKNWLEKINNEKGIICFSSTWNNPVLWGHYADKHRGMALGFEVNDDLPWKVNYEEHRCSLPSEGEFDQEKFLTKIIAAKFDHWQYESEWRIFCDLKNERLESGLYFEDFSESLKLTEVVLGLKCEISEEKIQELIFSMGMDAKVIKAKISDHEFKVIE